MKTYIISACIILCIVMGVIVYPNFVKEHRAYDTEQMGLNDMITIRFSHVVAENTPKGRTALYFKKTVEAHSNGKIHVELYPNGMLYNDETEMDALKTNEIQMIAPTYSKISSEVPAWEVLDLPFLFDNEQQVQTVLNGATGQALLMKVEAASIHGLGFWQNGFKQIISSEQLVQHVSGFEGRSMRTMKSDVLLHQGTLLGAHTTAISFEEVNKKIDQQQIDVQENTLSNIFSKSFYKKEPYITLSNHGILGYGVLMNSSFWNSLSSSNQRIITEAMTEASQWNEKNAQAMNEADLEQMKRYGTTIATLSPKEKKQWENALSPLYDAFKKEHDPTLLQQIEEITK